LTTVVGLFYYYIRSSLYSSGRGKTTNARRRQNLLPLRYVTLCEARLRDSHRVGNHLFLLAGLLYSARLTGRRVSMPTDGWPLDDVFQLDDIPRPLSYCAELSMSCIHPSANDFISR